MTTLATLKEMRRMLVCYGFPTPAIDEEIALLTAVGDPFLSPAEVAEVRAVLLAKGYAHPMVSMGIAKVPEAAALLAVDLVGAGTRVMDVGDCCDDGDPNAWIDGLNDARQNDRDALDLEERTRR